ncbi:hypothetical protein S83_052346 [Arachis hypogaea]
MNELNQIFLEFCKQKYQRQKECDVGEETRGGAGEGGGCAWREGGDQGRRGAHRWRRREGVRRESARRGEERVAEGGDRHIGVPNAGEDENDHEEGEAMQLWIFTERRFY